MSSPVRSLTVTLKAFVLTWERWLVGLSLGVALGLGYYVIDIYHAAHATDVPHDFSHPLDEKIPLVPAMIYIYNLYYPFVLWAIASVKTRELFYRGAMAFFLEFTLAYAVFMLFPSRIIRPDIPLDTFTNLMVGWFYDYDPGYNIFPSLHVANCVLVAWIFYKNESRWTWFAIVMASLICSSTVLVKAHYILDIPGGLALALLSIRLSYFTIQEGFSKLEPRW